ncbi:hypothetical protein [Acanthopleuribacter pedis]|uniref:Uncharacterized protein n=1 Tax=Acanthopleuribacter pedis TaxID=442870 RepID=A0A8J7Q8P9_9BACT|nr:hypothetical protein [Acanthopleuribacter pedis]MBO1318964.1 hypothetical protein [Acanthopleuribacter pedis]
MSRWVMDHRERGWAWHRDADCEGMRTWREVHRYLHSEDSDPLWETVAATRAHRPPPRTLKRFIRQTRTWFAGFPGCDDVQLGLTLDSGRVSGTPSTGQARAWQNQHRWRLAVSLRATLVGTLSLDLVFAQNHLPLRDLLDWFSLLQQTNGFETISLQRFRTRYPGAAIQMDPWQWAPPLAASLDHLRLHPHPRARWHEPGEDGPESASFRLADGQAQVCLYPNPVFSVPTRERWRFIAYDGHEHVLFITGRWQGVRRHLAVALTQPLHRYFPLFAFARDHQVLVLNGAVYRLPGVLWPGP